MNIFDFMYEPLRFDKNKPIKLFEAFSGIGTQSLALKYLGIKVEHIGISEVDHHAINSYNAIHGEIKNYGGVGSFDRFPKDIDICTWSFPCQDISLAGRQKGMEDGTQSNYGYVFLDTIKNMDYKDRPKVLLMENVKALLSETFREDWKEINLRLEKLGYKNYADSLIATDYGVPQTRDRVFIVSVKGEFSYSFPKPFKLQKKLKDYLETKVDEKYYLSDNSKVLLNYKNFEAKQNEEDGFELLNRYSEITNKLYEEKLKRKELNLKIAKDPNLQIRKLTPLESWRLMGIDDEDFYKAKASGMSDSQLYKQAGNAIVVDVLYYIFKQFIKGEKKNESII